MISNLNLSRGKLIYLGFAIAILLIIPSIFYGVALKLTFFLTLIPAFGVGWLTRNDPSWLKISIATWALIFIFFATILLAEVARFLYFLLTLTFILAQDLVFKSVHYIKNYNDWFTLFRGASLKDSILYLIPMVALCVGAWLSFPDNAYQNIREMPFSFSLIDAFSGGEPIQYLFDFTNATYDLGVSNIRSLMENLLKVAGFSILLLIPTSLYKIYDPL
ncbi:hypothetical protein [uncultured Psychrobacter sp.]|uniref:hypothetical protein n=1 Tax=uncultured Psychrobacter sp. TaxID=259303 RepID=UPI00262181E7|nr:hypothetical protein [uncultured Psychrobacter sp.]